MWSAIPGTGWWMLSSATYIHTLNKQIRGVIFKLKITYVIQSKSLTLEVYGDFELS